jgi:hypothetical protein
LLLLVLLLCCSYLFLSTEDSRANFPLGHNLLKELLQTAKIELLQNKIKLLRDVFLSPKRVGF